MLVLRYMHHAVFFAKQTCNISTGLQDRCKLGALLHPEVPQMVWQFLLEYSIVSDDRWNKNTWQFRWCPFWGMVRSRDPNSKVTSDFQRLGIKRSLRITNQDIRVLTCHTLHTVNPSKPISVKPSSSASIHNSTNVPKRDNAPWRCL